MARTLSFATLHVGVAFTVGFAMTGDPWVGGTLALVEPICNTVAYHFHERVWQRLGRRNATARTGRSRAPGSVVAAAAATRARGAGQRLPGRYRSVIVPS